MKEGKKGRREEKKRSIVHFATTQNFISDCCPPTTQKHSSLDSLTKSQAKSKLKNTPSNGIFITDGNYF